MKKSREQVRFVERLIILKSLIFIVYAFSPFAYMGYYVDGNYIHNGQLTLGYSNPNSTAIYLFCTFSTLLCLVEIKRNDSQIKRIGMFAILAALAYLIICTGSRLEIGCTIAVVTLKVIGTKGWTKKILTSRCLIIFFVLLPAVFLWVFFVLYRVLPSGFTLMGRGLFARIIIYQKALSSLAANLWFGNMGEWLFTNSHNGLLTIAVNLGVTGLLVYLFFLYRNLERYVQYIIKNNSANIIPYFMIIAFLLQACAEASSLTGGVSFMSGVAIATYLCEINNTIGVN